ncbi:hypothetical protein B4N84_12460, partial [Flavobacterium sp. IR1]
MRVTREVALFIWGLLCERRERKVEVVNQLYVLKQHLKWSKERARLFEKIENTLVEIRELAEEAMSPQLYEDRQELKERFIKLEFQLFKL